MFVSCVMQGNKYFKKGKYDEAVSCYTKGIQCDATNAALYANRAMALLKQDKYVALSNFIINKLVPKFYAAIDFRHSPMRCFKVMNVSVVFSLMKVLHRN